MFLLGAVSPCLFAQAGYAKDSLQIKVYTEIDYVNNQPEAIAVKKVFCDYCTETQINYIKEEALYRSYHERFSLDNRLKNGKKKLALYIRISKKDFIAIKYE